MFVNALSCRYSSCAITLVSACIADFLAFSPFLSLDFLNSIIPAFVKTALDSIDFSSLPECSLSILLELLSSSVNGLKSIKIRSNQADNDYLLFLG